MAHSWPKRLFVQANHAHKRVLDLLALRVYMGVGSLRDDPARASVEAEILISEACSVASDFPQASPALLDYEFEPRSALILKDVQVWSNQSIVMTRERSLIRETAFTESRFQRALDDRTFGRYPRKTVRELCTTIDVGRWHNHYHFVVDMLPRLHALWHPGVQRLGLVRVFLTRRLSSVQMHLVEAVLPSNAHLEVLRWPVRLQASRYLWLPYLSGNRSGFLPADYIDRFLEQALRALGVQRQGTAREAVLISRRDAKSRRLLNEKDLLKGLAPLGFREYVLESMSLAEQVALFVRASAVIAPHGAGLTNLLFSSPDCRVVELFAGESAPHYRLLAQARGHRYGNVVGSGNHRNDDFSVDVDSVIAKFEALG